MAVFILEDALSVQTDWPFLYYSRIIRLDELGQTFVIRLVRVAQDALRVILRNTS